MRLRYKQATIEFEWQLQPQLHIHDYWTPLCTRTDCHSIALSLAMPQQATYIFAKCSGALVVVWRRPAWVSLFPPSLPYLSTNSSATCAVHT